MRTLFKVILSAAAAVALFSCGRNGGREAIAPQESAAPELRDTCVSFSADSCDTFGKWLSSRLKTDFTDVEAATSAILAYDAAGERQSDFSISFTIDEDGDMKNIYIKGTDSTDISGFSPVQKFLIATLKDAPEWNRQCPAALLPGFDGDSRRSAAVTALLPPYLCDPFAA